MGPGVRKQLIPVSCPLNIFSAVLRPKEVPLGYGNINF